MSVLPSNISRTSNLLRSQLATSGLQRTNQSMIEVQTQLSTGRSINRASDDPIRAAAVSLLDSRLNMSGQRARNLSHASTVMGTLDSAFGQVTELLRNARSTASSQIGVTSDAITRRQQATVVDSMIQSLMTLANRDVAGIHVFGGSATSRPPIVAAGGGYRYVGSGAGMLTDIGLGDVVPITVSGNNAIGETSAAVQSSIDLSPALTGQTRLTDLRGATDRGVTPSTITFSFNGGTFTSVDLAGAVTADDVANRIEVAIRAYEVANSVSILDTGGVSVTGQGLRFDMIGLDTLSFSDVGSGTAAGDLGISATAFVATNEVGGNPQPRLTMQTPLSAVPGLTLPLGSVRVKLGQGPSTTQRVIDLSSALTVDDLRASLEAAGLGLQVRINEAATGLSVVHQTAGQVLSIEEMPGGAATASQLGIRTFDYSTPISTFNHGRGVRIATGGTDPVTGLPDPAADVDFQVTLGSGQKFNVDLRPQDVLSVQTILDRINQQFTVAIGQSPIVSTAPALAAGDFNATLTDGANGIAFVQTLGPGEIAVAKVNNSAAAEDLGLFAGVYDSASSTLLAQDRSTLRVNNIFSDLLDLREALLKDDTAGITLAGERLEASDDRVSAAHAVVGSLAARIEQAALDLEDRNVLDEQTRSSMIDLDFAEAASRFSLLQTQLEASLRVTGQSSGRSLFDFLNF